MVFFDVEEHDLAAAGNLQRQLGIPFKIAKVQIVLHTLAVHLQKFVAR